MEHASLDTAVDCVYQLNELNELTELAYVDFERGIVMPVTKTLASDTPNIALSMKLPRKADFEKALLNQFTKAVQLSQKAGHQVRFRSKRLANRTTN
ncbi:hypothetical protein RHI9324_04720 [Rhizobium sp. CECT 9324]|nr:hypothetical protein RHI9324_04720 [Rhizobium sp. CECT 9324]